MCHSSVHETVHLQVFDNDSEGLLLREDVEEGLQVLRLRNLLRSCITIFGRISGIRRQASSPG